MFTVPPDSGSDTRGDVRQSLAMHPVSHKVFDLAADKHIVVFRYRDWLSVLAETNESHNFKVHCTPRQSPLPTTCPVPT